MFIGVWFVAEEGSLFAVARFEDLGGFGGAGLESCFISAPAKSRKGFGFYASYSQNMQVPKPETLTLGTL